MDQTLCCDECGETFHSLLSYESHSINEHTDLTFRGQFIYVPDERSLAKYCAVRGFIAYWSGQGWYGRDDYQDCDGEWQTQVVPVLSILEGCQQQIASAQRKIEIILELPTKPDR